MLGAGAAGAGALGRRRQQRAGVERAGGLAVGARGALTSDRRAGRGKREGRGTARARARRTAWAWLGAGRCLGERAVHSVHLAHFRSVLTRYFPESNFLDIVREPGS